MRKTTLCYIEHEGKYLMLHRTRKTNDPNHGKWLGIGGGIEPGESVEACLMREVREETGLTLTQYALRGLVHFRSDIYEDEEMYLFTSRRYTGTLTDCDEGELKWIEKEEVPSLNLWEGDRVFLDLLRNDAHYFDLVLVYEGETLVRTLLNGKEDI